jgi:hypothetical protein
VQILGQLIHMIGAGGSLALAVPTQVGNDQVPQNLRCLSKRTVRVRISAQDKR